MRRIAPLLTVLLVPALAGHSTLHAAGPPLPKEKPKPNIVRWSEDLPGCTFSADNDGKYRYGLWSGDVGIIVAIDSREVQIIRRRIEPILGVLVTVKIRGTGQADFDPGNFSLKFVKHFNVVQTSIDPDNYTQKIQQDADALDHETAREVAKHPEQREAREKRLQEYQKSANELMEFITRQSLRPAHLDQGNPEATGWVFFNTDNKWLGGWKAQEEFVLSVPMERKIFEFPFLVPPKQGELLLRKRE